MSILDLARPDVRALEPYSSARGEAGAGSIWLNANESPWPPFGLDADWNRYPDPQPAALVRRLAQLYGVAPDQLLVGRGSDEGIDLLVRAFCSAGRDAVLISPPTFGLYAVCAGLQGAGIVEVPLRRDCTLDIDAVRRAASPAVRIVFACAPNNPTGVATPRTALLELASSLSGRALLVVDEAYVEFTEPGEAFASVAPCIDALENLVVLRTLSKAWALAGIRIGTLLANREVISLLRRIMPPYPLPTPCVEAALQALSDDGLALMEQRCAQTRAERTRMCIALSRLACVREVLPSQANFLTVRFQEADAAWRSLSNAGIVVRNVRGHPALGDALRITLGTPAENDQVLAVLETVGARPFVPALTGRMASPA